jgi:hypothetical protein
MNITLRALLLLAATGITLAATAADRRETRGVSGFHGVDMQAPMNLRIVQGDAEGLVIEGDEDLVAEVETRVENGVLRILLRKRINFVRNNNLRGVLTARRIDSVVLAGSGDITAAALRGDRVDARISGSGDLRVDQVEAGRVEAAISGSGTMRLEGKAPQGLVRISGSGDIHAEGLEARELEVSITGSGSARVWATSQLGVRITGAGDVRYRGEPRVERSILGAGSIGRLARS